MSNLLADQTYLLNEQYQDASNLNARIQLYERFSTKASGLFEAFRREHP